MIGNGYLAARPESRADDRAGAIDGFLRDEFRGASMAWLAAQAAPAIPRVQINGGRNGWMADARRAAARISAILLSVPPRRASAGRASPRILPVSADTTACPRSSSR